MELMREQELRLRKISINPISLIFWIIFSFVYLYMNQLMFIATQDNFRLGFFALFLALALIFISQKVILNYSLALVIIFLSFTIVLSAIINNTPLLQFLAFIRIPVIFYLIYQLVSKYIHSSKHASKVLNEVCKISSN